MLGTMASLIKLGKLLKKERLKKGLSQRQLSIMSGVSRAYINLLEGGYRGGRTSVDIITALARGLNIDIQELINVEQGKIRSFADIISEAKEYYDALELIELPIRGSVPAGIPFPNEEETGEFIEVPRQALSGFASQNLYALKISGHSLQGDGIYSGDSVVVNPDDTAIQDGKIYIIRLDNEVCARHVFKQNDYLRLVSSDNISQEIKASEVEILGRILLSGRWKQH